MANIAVQYMQPDGMGSNTPTYMDLKTGANITPAELPYYDSTVDQKDVDSGKIKLPPEDQKKYEEVFRPDGQRGQTPQGSTAGPRSMSNDFGYANKPAGMGLLGMMPGPVGMVGKAANLAMNVNNRQAIKDARSTIGFAPKTDLGSLISDKQGQVGELKIGREVAPVGFEAQDSIGRTNMLPNEARQRQMLAGATEATPADVKTAKTNFKAENPDAHKPGVFDAAKSISHNMFTSTPKTDTVAAVNPNEHPGVQAAKGLGLMDLSPSFKQNALDGQSVAQNANISAGVDYSHPERGDVTKGLTQKSVDTMSALAGETPGGIHVTSAFRGGIDPKTGKSYNDEVSGASKSYHLTGQAFDVSTKDMTNAQRRDTVERAVMAGAQEIGTYSDNSLHIATDARNPTNIGGVAAMYDRSEMNMDKAPGWFTDGLQQSRLAPTPIDRPEQQPAGVTGPQMATDNAQTSINRPTGMMQQPTQTSTPMASNESTKTSPEDHLSKYDKLSPEDRTMMAMTLAGEIDPTKTDLSTPVASQEAYGMLSTMDNRVGKYGTMQGVLSAPKQYSTWNDTPSATTAVNNYKANPSVYDGMVKSYYDNPDNNKGFTNYHATTVNPAWGASMQNPTQIGAHTFGTLSEYSNSQPQAVATSPAPMATPSLTNASSLGFTSPTDASIGTSTGDSSVGATQSSTSMGGATGGGSGSRSDGDSSSSSNSGGMGGGFASSPSGQNNSSSDSNSSSGSPSPTNGGRSGYGGSRSDGWN